MAALTKHATIVGVSDAGELPGTGPPTTPLVSMQLRFDAPQGQPPGTLGQIVSLMLPRSEYETTLGKPELYGRIDLTLTPL